MKTILILTIYLFGFSVLGQTENNVTVDTTNGASNADKKSENNIKPQRLNSYNIAKKFFPKFQINKNGIYLEKNENTLFDGEQYVHLFFDEFGMPMFTSLPQGRANRKYVAHIFYNEVKLNDEQNFVSYHIIGSGTLNTQLSIYNSGGFSNIEPKNKQSTESTIVEYFAKHAEFLMPEVNSDLLISISRTTIVGIETATNNLISHTIKMTPSYHVGLSLGLFKSFLVNPSFTLIEDPNNTNQKIVKEEENNSRSQMAALVTFYYSPFKILRSAFLKKAENPFIGRNFIDDDKLLERIYPSIGIKLGEKSLENLFFGFNWEIFRGGGIYFGSQYARVNNFDKSIINNFKFRETPVSQAQFNLMNEKKWKSNWVFGATIDLSIAQEFFKRN